MAGSPFTLTFDLRPANLRPPSSALANWSTARGRSCQYVAGFHRHMVLKFLHSLLRLRQPQPKQWNLSANLPSPLNT